ncbi:MAG TPA: type II secretion system protein [Candidatus Saccharimonadales bacterium]|nr:type II secretion system protein [Candidatus Saccharimonadales bacterium]
MKSKTHLEQKGFTIVELITVMAVTLVLMGMIVTFTIDYWGNSANIQADLQTFNSRLNAQDQLRQLISASDGLIIQNSIADLHTLDADPAIPSGQYWLPIHAIPGNTTMGSSGTIKPILYFRRPSQNTSHTIVYNGTVTYDDEYVLYLDGSRQALMLRTLANPNVVNNIAKTSCPPALASSSCPSDKTVIDNLSSVDMRYFSRSGNTIDWTSVYDSLNSTYAGPDYPLVEAVEFTLHESAKAQFHGVNNASNITVIRIALLNI